MRIHELQDDLGEKPPRLVDRFGAPSLWGTVGVMGSPLLTLEEELPNSSTIQEEDVNDIASRLTSGKFQELEENNSNLKNTLINVFKHFNAQFLLQDQELLTLSNNRTPPAEESNFDLQSLEERIKELEEDQKPL